MLERTKKYIEMKKTLEECENKDYSNAKFVWKRDEDILQVLLIFTGFITTLIVIEYLGDPLLNVFGSLIGFVNVLFLVLLSCIEISQGAVYKTQVRTLILSLVLFMPSSILFDSTLIGAAVVIFVSPTIVFLFKYFNILFIKSRDEEYNDKKKNRLKKEIDIMKTDMLNNSDSMKDIVKNKKNKHLSDLYATLFNEEDLLLLCEIKQERNEIEKIKTI